MTLPSGLLLNTTPSGHVAWLLLLCWFSWKYSSKLTAAIITCLSMVITMATLALGEHYVIDLVLAVPLAAAVWSLAVKAWARSVLLLATVVASLCALRQGWLLGTPAPIVWFASVACIFSVWIAPLRSCRSGETSRRDRRAVSSSDRVWAGPASGSVD